MKLTRSHLRDFILNEVHTMLEKKDPKAAVRNRGDVVFPAGSSKVLDDQDHFPINTEKQARAALGYANHYEPGNPPSWYGGSVSELVKAVVSVVERKFPGINISDAARNPGPE